MIKLAGGHKFFLILLSYILIFFNTNILGEENNNKLKIGLLAPFTGEYKDLGNSLLLSIQLAALFQLAVFFIYIWIFISFIDVALKLENLFKAFFVTFSGLIAAFISVSMVLSLFVGLFNV